MENNSRSSTAVWKEYQGTLIRSGSLNQQFIVKKICPEEDVT